MMINKCANALIPLNLAVLILLNLDVLILLKIDVLILLNIVNIPNCFIS